MNAPGWGDGPYPKFSQAEVQRRFHRVRDMMRREGVEALIVHAAPGAGGAVHYLSHYIPSRPAWLVFPLEGPSTLFLHFYNHIPCTQRLSIVEDVRCYHPSPGRAVAENLKERDMGSASIGVVGLGTSIPYGQFQTLKGEAPDAAFVDLAESLNAIRVIRSEEEISWFRESARLTDLTCEALEREIRPGLSEYNLSALIHDAFLPESGHMGIHFISTTNMENPERPVPWQYLTPRKLQKGDAVITEITITYWGYATQIHRPFAVAAEPSPTYRKLFDVALECYEAVRAITKPGTTSEEIIETASKMTEEKGYPILDSLFHGEGGRNPELGTRNSNHPFESYTLEENMVVVIQPNPMTPDGKAGLQLGAALVVKPGGGECLHRYPFHFPVCG
ncbi:MAG: M24 family metallopeptidase [Nitrospinota bacterium]